MIAADVNVLVAAYRPDAEFHAPCRAWLEARLASDEPLAVSELVLSGFLRVTTHPRIFRPPEPWPRALAFAQAVQSAPQAIPLTPGPRHWEIFVRQCEAVQARGNLIADAYFAALAIEVGCEWVTLDGDYARFPGLRWRRPF